MSHIRIDGVRKSFGSLEVIGGLSAVFPDSSVTAIIGPSGCGKTTLLNCVAGLLSCDSGSIEKSDGSTCSFAFQEPRLLPWMSATENIRYALSGVMDAESALGRAEHYLAAAGLGDFMRSRPGSLSGGMRQRLSLARAFAFPSSILLLDEAFSSVDLKVKIGLMDLYSSLWESERRTTLLVTHDIQEAVYLADRILVLTPAPARIAAEVMLSIPRTSRVFGSCEELEAESRLYDLVLGREGGFRPRDQHPPD